MHRRHVAARVVPREDKVLQRAGRHAEDAQVPRVGREGMGNLV